ncbi:MAG: hypothetical protein ABI450_00220 [Rhizomicrobium sp.]
MTMPKDVRVDPHEFTKAYQAYAEKVKSAAEALATHGVNSRQFADADARAEQAQKALRGK